MIPDGAIQPDLVAGKLAQAENLTRPNLAKQLAATPRLIELAWFIQWRSFQAGGLAKLAEDLLASFPDRFVSAAMADVGTPRGGRYSLDQCLTVWRAEWKGPSHERWRNELSALDRLEWFGDSHALPSPGIEHFAEFLGFYYHPSLTPAAVEHGRDCDKAALLKGVESFNWPFLKAHHQAEARRFLPDYLRDLAAEPSTDFYGARYCPALLESLFDLMDRHAADAAGRIALTEITRQVSDALSYAWHARKLVRVDGNARFGKTEAVKTWCQQFPGRARLVSVPCSNSETDLVRAFAESLGFAIPEGIAGPKLRAKVDFVLRNGGLGFVLDEAHFLWPIRYGPNTVPTRLNWIRTEIVDRGLPCALVTTPQAFDGQSAKFQRRTQYNLEQFTGRVALTVRLPDELEEKDLFSVARFHFPDLGAAQLKGIVGAAMASDGYLKAVEDIATRAQWLAEKRRKGAAVAPRDVMLAADEVVLSLAPMLNGGRPSAGAIVPPSNGEPAAKPARHPRLTPAEALATARPGARVGANSQSISSPELDTTDADRDTIPARAVAPA